MVASSAAPDGVGSGRTTGSCAVDDPQRRRGHVTGQQLQRRQPAGVRQLRQGGGQRDPGGDADRGLQRRGHDHRQTDLLGDPQAGRDPAERLHLEDGDVGGRQPGHPQRVLGPADRLVGGDRDVDAAAHRRQLLDRAAGLLDVLQPRDRSSSRIMRTAVSTSQPPLASTRTWPSGPSASRTASTRARSSASVWPGSATLTLAVRQPAEARHDLRRPARVRRQGPSR